MKSLFTSPAGGDDTTTEHAAAVEPGRRLPRLRPIRFHSIRTRGMVTGTGLVLLTIIIAVTAYSLSLRAYYYSAARTSLQAKAETASSFFSGYINRTYAEYFQSAVNYADNFEDKGTLELQFVDPQGRIEIASSGISSGSISGSDDIRSALSPGRISSWHGENPSTGEQILAVSAKFHALSEGIEKGAKLEDLVFSPLVYFVSPDYRVW